MGALISIHLAGEMEVGSHKLLFENLNSTPIHSILWTVLHKHGLRDRYGAALKENELQEAFDEIWPTWFSEMAAMIYAEVLSVLDLLLLTSV
ncbi:MAG: hypothetical protein OEW82_04735, partial [Dehalococcoidia bacterium]|nr:hypothetical protein [Dehalococcoidia bacterium]